ncbi:MAG: hypothetical protein MZU84_03315 [Sphingobacterium sp.]|nr:hypothetical protein [Sphingobacterium sp.]
MANMGYCRFSNTLHDLRDCYEHMDDEDLSDSESEARERLIEVCREIAGEIKNKQEPHKMAEFVTQTGQLNERLTIKTFSCY